MIRSWYTGLWWIWYSEEGPGRAAAPPSPLLAVPNVTAHPSTASVSITVLLYDGPLRWTLLRRLKSYVFSITTHRQMQKKSPHTSSNRHIVIVFRILWSLWLCKILERNRRNYFQKYFNILGQSASAYTSLQILWRISSAGGTSLRRMTQQCDTDITASWENHLWCYCCCWW